MLLGLSSDLVSDIRISKYSRRESTGRRGHVSHFAAALRDLPARGIQELLGCRLPRAPKPDSTGSLAILTHLRTSTWALYLSTVLPNQDGGPESSADAFRGYID